MTSSPYVGGLTSISCDVRYHCTYLSRIPNNHSRTIGEVNGEGETSSDGFGPIEHACVLNGFMEIEWLVERGFITAFKASQVLQAVNMSNSNRALILTNRSLIVNSKLCRERQ